MRIVYFIALLFVLAILQGGEMAHAQERPESRGKLRRNPGFEVPAALRPRVDFWIDIFTKYGKHQAVLHHREFPQAVFAVLDFSQAAEDLSPVAYEVTRKRRIKEVTDQIAAILRRFAQGDRPSDAFEQGIWDAMQLVPGGKARYQQTVDEELIRSQTGIKEKSELALQRSGRYLPFIEKIFVEDFGMPVELTRLPFIESSFDYRAYSSVGAAGIWQFMRSTGKLYLTINNAVDERRDVFESTAAAAKYLRSAYGRLSNWPLAITSYNHGVAGVMKRTRTIGTTDLAEIIEHPQQRVFGFASGNFYPEFLAALDVFENYQHYFPGLQLDTPPKLAMFKLQKPLSVGHVANQLGAELDELKAVNYALSDAVWNGRIKIPAGHTIKIPADFSGQLARLYGPEALTTSASAPAASSVYGGIVYKVRKGDTLGSIAKHYGVSVKDLRENNSLKSDKLVIGRTLVVKERESGPSKEVVRAANRNEDQDSSEATTASSKAPIKLAAPQRQYRVRSGDSWWTIARAHNTTVAELQQANEKVGTKLKPGQVLVIR